VKSIALLLIAPTLCLAQYNTFNVNVRRVGGIDTDPSHPNYILDLPDPAASVMKTFNGLQQAAQQQVQAQQEAQLRALQIQAAQMQLQQANEETAALLREVLRKTGCPARGSSGPAGVPPIPTSLDASSKEPDVYSGPSDLSLFGADAAAVAYISDDLTIYLWSGEPVAYLEPDGLGTSHVYGFNGKHLGWFKNGVLRDHDGLVVGARREALAVAGQFEPFKGFKQFKPLKALKELAPVRPLFSDTWSEVSLRNFLLQRTDSEVPTAP
jgi:hypothetical protein